MRSYSQCLRDLRRGGGGVRKRNKVAARAKRMCFY